MTDKTEIIVSSIVDATVKESQPDVDFKMFRQLEQLGAYLETDAIRASTMFITSDVIVQPNSSFSYIIDILENNKFLKVDRVIYITEEKAPEVKVLRYLLDRYGIENWEVLEGPMTRAYVSSVIGGTLQQDKFISKRKAVIRIPRRDYLKQQMRNKESLDEEYEDDDADLMDIEDVPVPEEKVLISESHMQKRYIAGKAGEERTAFALLAAQYLSMGGKTILLENDPEFHSTTEFVTKSEVDALLIPLDRLMADTNAALQEVKETEKKLIVFICINRIEFSYKFICDLVFYNLRDSADYMIIESDLDEVPKNTDVTVVLPNTVIGCLKTCENIDIASLSFYRFVAVSFHQIQEVHIESGAVMSKLLQDLLSDTRIECPVVTVTSLRISASPYDLGKILNWRDS